MTNTEPAVGHLRVDQVARPGFALQVLPILLTDLLMVFAGGAATVLIRYYLGGEFDLTFYLSIAGLIAVFISVFAILGLYSIVMLHPVTELRRIFLGTTFTVLLLGTLTFFVRNAQFYSRAILLVSWILIGSLVWMGRVLVRGYLSRQAWWGEPAVVLGAGHVGRDVAELLRRRRETGLRVVALLSDEDPATAEHSQGTFIRAPLSAALSLAADGGVRYAILAMPQLRGEELADIVERYASAFHHVVIIPDLGISSLDIDARDIGGMLGLTVSHRLVHRTPQIVKRIFDLTVTFIGGAVIIPLVALIYLAVRATSAGAGFYGQSRIGVGGSVFKAWKFRTMLKDSEQVLAQHLAGDPELEREWKRDHKLRNDPRVTPVGRVLRRTSLDELPQLWNIFRGEMSLVGPRPIVKAEIEKYGKRYALYTKVRPGLTGMWQVSGRNNTTYEERVRFDEYYVRNWSVWLDLYILSRTIRVVLTKEGAY